MARKARSQRYQFVPVASGISVYDTRVRDSNDQPTHIGIVRENRVGAWEIIWAPDHISERVRCRFFPSRNTAASHLGTINEVVPRIAREKLKREVRLATERVRTENALLVAAVRRDTADSVQSERQRRKRQVQGIRNGYGYYDVAKRAYQLKSEWQHLQSSGARSMTELPARA